LLLDQNSFTTTVRVKLPGFSMQELTPPPRPHKLNVWVPAASPVKMSAVEKGTSSLLALVPPPTTAPRQPVFVPQTSVAGDWASSTLRWKLQTPRVEVDGSVGVPCEFQSNSIFEAALAFVNVPMVRSRFTVEDGVESVVAPE
jgi:hypothetical protein